MVSIPATDRNLDGYGTPVIEWSRVQQRLDHGISQAPGTGGPGRHTPWLATTNPDGRPHVVPVGIVWTDGKVYFTSGPGTRKSKNLSSDPHCTVTVATEQFDIVIEGQASRVTAMPPSAGWPTCSPSRVGSPQCVRGRSTTSSAPRARGRRPGTCTSSGPRRYSPSARPNPSARPASTSSQLIT